MREVLHMRECELKLWIGNMQRLDCWTLVGVGVGIFTNRYWRGWGCGKGG